MSMRPNRWLFFVAAFCLLHFAFWLFVLVRNLASASQNRLGDVCMGILGIIFISIWFGPLTGVKFAIGYALTDTILARRERRAVWHRYDPGVAAVLASLLLFAGLSLREQMPRLADSLADSYLGGSMRSFDVSWAAIFLGGLSGALTAAVGIIVDRRRRAAAP